MTRISWENSPWKQLSLVNDEEVISLSHAKVYVFSDSVLCLGKMNQNPESNSAWEEKVDLVQEFITLQLINKVQEFMTKMGDASQLKGRVIFMSHEERS